MLGKWPPAGVRDLGKGTGRREIGRPCCKTAEVSRVLRRGEGWEPKRRNPFGSQDLEFGKTGIGTLRSAVLSAQPSVCLWPVSVDLAPGGRFTP